MGLGWQRIYFVAISMVFLRLACAGLADVNRSQYQNWLNLRDIPSLENAIRSRIQHHNQHPYVIQLLKAIAQPQSSAYTAI